MSKVVKYTCSLRRYNYTHDQLNTIDILLSVFRNFFEGGGAQNSSVPPGARYPRYATDPIINNNNYSAARRQNALIRNYFFVYSISHQPFLSCVKIAENLLQRIFALKLSASLTNTEL